MKRYITFLLLLVGVFSLQAQPTHPSFKLFATKVELSGEVKLVWTKPLSATNATQYELHRAKLPDTIAVLIKTTSDTSTIDKVPPIVSSVTQNFAYYVLAKTGTIVENSNVIVLSIPSIPPIGSFKLEGKVESLKVKLSWQKPPIPTVDYYLVYRAMMINGMPPGVIEQIDSTTNLWSVTNAPTNFILRGMSQTVIFYVKAKLSSGEVLQSTSAYLTIENRTPKDEVKFVSVPPKYGQVNKKYEYTAKAVSNDSTAVIRYYGKATYGMLTVETGFMIDSITGVVGWAPLWKGWYSVFIYAKSSKGGIAKQEFNVAVAGGNGIVQGKVTDTLNVGISKVLIEVFKVENSTVFSFAYSTLTDEKGNYRIGRIDPGSYKLRASAPGRFQSQWYD